MVFRNHTRRTYKNPPIDEALCAFYFAMGTEWDLTLPGRLHERISAIYDGKPRQQSGFEARLEQNVQDSTLAFRQATQRVQLPNRAGNRLAAIGPESLSIHMLRPYGGWDEEFKGQIQQVCDAFTEVSDAEISRLALRYINRIEIPETYCPLNEYFALSMNLPDDYPQPLRGFFHRVESNIDDTQVSLALTFANTNAPEGKSAFLLDLDLTWTLSEPTTLNDAAERMDQLRTMERDVFESMITDKARSLFDAD